MASRTAVVTQFRYTLHPRLFLRFVNEKLTAAIQVSVHRSGNKELSRGRREQSRPDGPKDDDIMHGRRPGNSGRSAGKRVRFGRPLPFPGHAGNDALTLRRATG